MKLLCLILSFYVIVLSIKPCCTDNDRCRKEVDKTELAGKMPVKEKDCPGCSPFFTCGTCAGFVAAKPIRLQIKPVIETPVKMYFAYQHPSIQQVSLSIWQPPQLS